MEYYTVKVGPNKESAWVVFGERVSYNVAYDKLIHEMSRYKNNNCYGSILDEDANTIKVEFKNGLPLDELRKAIYQAGFKAGSAQRHFNDSWSKFCNPENSHLLELGSAQQAEEEEIREGGLPQEFYDVMNGEE